MTEIPKFFADFNNADEQGRVRLNSNGSLADQKKLNVELKEGMQVILDDDDSLTTVGRVKFSDEEKIWVAEINWNDIKHTEASLRVLNYTEVQKEFTLYRQLIQNAKSIEPDQSLIKQYNDHLNSLDEIETAFNTNDRALLTKLIEQESRYCGWSYLPNDYGEKVEASFWNLKKIIQNNN